MSNANQPVDIDVGHRTSWSIEKLGMPLPMAFGVLAFAVMQTALFSIWLGQLSSDVKTLVHNQDKGEPQIYQLKDAQRDFALRDQRDDTLDKRITQLEHNDGKNR
jgi:hypothetical protein